MIKLFLEITLGTIFHFYDRPSRELIKTGEKSYIGPERVEKQISPTVLVVEKKYGGEDERQREIS